MQEAAAWETIEAAAAAAAEESARAQQQQEEGARGDRELEALDQIAAIVFSGDAEGPDEDTTGAAGGGGGYHGRAHGGGGGGSSVAGSELSAVDEEHAESATQRSSRSREHHGFLPVMWRGLANNRRRGRSWRCGPLGTPLRERAPEHGDTDYGLEQPYVSLN